MKKKLSSLFLLLLLTGCAAAPITEGGQNIEEQSQPVSNTEETALVQEDSSTPAPYIYSNGEIILEFDGGTNFIARKGAFSRCGTYVWDGFTLLMQDDRGLVSTGFLTPDGSLVLEGQNGVFTSQTERPLLPPQMKGRWKMQEKGVEVILYENGRLVFINSGQVRLYRFGPEGDGFAVYADEERIGGFVLLEDGSMEVEDLEGQRLLPVR